MNVYINSKLTEIPDNVDTLGKLLDYLKIPRQGTGIGVNNHLTVACNWDHTRIQNDDNILMISATFGG